MEQKLRIVYMGTPGFAVEPLRQLLLSEHQVCAVITAPDKPAGRGKQLKQSEVKDFVLGQHPHIPILQPVNLKDPQFIEELAQYQAQLFVVVAFRMLPEVVWNMPPLGTINIHASLLPQYRGAAPINWAIINGENETGVSSFVLSHQIDTGELIDQLKVNIEPNEIAGQLHDKLMYLGSSLLLDSLKKLTSDKFKTTPQILLVDQKLAPKLNKNNCLINWSGSIVQINNLIRGLSPAPAAYTYWQHASKGSMMVKVFQSHIEPTNPTQPLGSIISDGKTYLKIACVDGYVYLDEIQFQSKARMPIKQFLAGFRHYNEWVLDLNYSTDSH